MDHDKVTLENFKSLSAEAEASSLNGDWMTAAANYEALIRQHPNQNELRMKLGRAYLELAQWQKVINVLSDPSVVGFDKAKRMLVNVYIEMKDYEKATSIIDELIRLSPDDPKLRKWKVLCDDKIGTDHRLVEWMQRGEVLLSSDRLKEAEQVYKEVLTDYPDAVRAQFRLGQVYIRQRRWREAIAPLRAGMAADRTNIKLRIMLARALLKSGQPAEAIILLEELEAAQVDPEALLMLQRCHMRLCNWTSAGDVSARLLRVLSPEDPRREAVLATRQDAMVEMELETLSAKAETAISAGDWEVALAGYNDLVVKFPTSARAYLHLGQLYSRCGRWADAIPPLRAGLVVDPGNIKLKLRLARALLKSGQPAEAITLLEKSGGVQDDPEVLFILQRCHVRLSNWTSADDLSARLLNILPPGDPLRDSASAMRQDAMVLRELESIGLLAESGHHEQAISAYRDLSGRHPSSALAWLRLGKALAEAEQDDEAANALRKSLSLRPDDLKIRRELTRVVIRTSDDDEVLRYAREVIAAGTADFECYRWLARYHVRLFDWPSALESARSALALVPEHPSTRLLVVRTLMHLARLPEALDELEIAISFGAKPAQALQLKGDIFVRLARVDDAIELYRAALRAEPKHPLISSRLSSTLLLKGDIAGFHRFHEKRRETTSFIVTNKERPYLQWNGELTIHGKLLVWSEFGLGVGQNVLHMTFLNSLCALGLDVVFEVEPRLLDLCRRSFPDITVVANDAALPTDISHHIPIGSLSRWLKPDLESFSSLRPYLIPDAASVASHRERLQRVAGDRQLLVGVSWTSNNPFVGDVKSVQLDEFLSKVASPDVTLVNLQYGDHSQAIAAATATTGARLMDSGVDNDNDLDGVAAVIAAMDLVVCIGHTTAHIAGAVGKPNFVLLPAAPFAHWLAQGEQCIWYPATKLFRQAPIDGGWATVLDLVGRAIGEFAEANIGFALGQDAEPSKGAAPGLPPREICDAVLAFTAQGAYRSALELISRLPPDLSSSKLDLHRADLLERIGQWSEALTLLASMPRGVEGNYEVQRQMLSVRLAMHDLDLALPIAQELAAFEPAYRLTVANIFYRLRQYERALIELRALSLEAPQLEGLALLMGNVLLETGQLNRAETYLLNQSALMRRSEEYTLLGRCLSAQGRQDEALVVFEKVRAFSENNPLANFWRTQARIKCGAVTLDPLPPVLGDFPDVSRDDLVVYFVADSAYFWQHALILLASLGHHSPRAKCHMHVINPDDGVAKAVEIIEGMLPELKLSYSFEHVNFEGCSPLHIRTYYASVRYVRLAEVFARSPASYLCMDVDGIVRGDVEAHASQLEVGDIGIRMRFDDRPHLAILASAMLLRPTPSATKFINLVSSLIRSTLEAREAVWFLDQVVLNNVLRELGNGEVCFNQLDLTYIDWFFHDHSLIWTGKGARKSDDNRYIGEVSRYRFIQTEERIKELMRRNFEEVSIN